jgi:hypothetical protein
VAALLDDARTRLRRELGREHAWRQRDLLRPRTLAALDQSAGEVADVLDGVDPAIARLELARLADDALNDRRAPSTKPSR